MKRERKMSRRYACQLSRAIDRAALRKITSLRRTCENARSMNAIRESIHARVKKSLLCLRPLQRKKPLIGQVATPAREVYGTQRRVFATRTHTAVCISRAEKLRHACTHIYARVGTQTHPRHNTEKHKELLACSELRSFELERWLLHNAVECELILICREYYRDKWFLHLSSDKISRWIAIGCSLYDHEFYDHNIIEIYMQNIIYCV